MKNNVLIFLLALWFDTSTSKRRPKSYTNTWIVKTFEGEDFIKQIAQEHGFSYHGLAMSYTDHYKFKKDDLPEQSKTRRADLTHKLMEHEKVLWAGQMRVKRVSLRGRKHNQKGKPKMERRRKNKLGVSRSFRMDYGQGSSSSNPGRARFPTTPRIGFQQSYPGPTKNIILTWEKNRDSAYRNIFTDSHWVYQWYEHDYRIVDGPVMDHNVVPVYGSLDASGRPITGQGVTIAVVDEAVDGTHSDLVGTLIPELSYDFLRDSPNLPRGEKHGTYVAGVLVMIPNNIHCGVGIAFGAKIAGLRVIGNKEGPTDQSYGSALGHALGHIDIYSNSWNGDTGGNVFDAADHMEYESIRKGVAEGRQNRGSIYVFGTGNLKDKGDNCAYNGILQNPNIILVGAASSLGKVTPYAMTCSNVFVAAYSGDGLDDDSQDETGLSEEGVVTTALRGKCTTEFEGTSAAVPMVSGIIALVLQANPNLTYRDIQHLITMTAEVAPLADNPGTWQQNKAGFWVSQDFGFGLMNAENMVNMARQWTNVEPQITCRGVYEYNPPKQFSSEQRFTMRLGSDACENTKYAITFLEKVEVTFNFNYPGERKDLSISLISPQGTVVPMIRPRPLDVSRQGMRNWSVTSVQTWGEDPKGNWFVVIENSHRNLQENDESSSRPAKRQKIYSSTGVLVGTIVSFKLTWHGLANRPAHLANGPRNNYASFRT